MTNKGRMTISIGIPAYNEEQNIRHLLERLMRQEYVSCSLREIIIIADGCTDGTIREVRRVTDDRILLIIFPAKKGLAAGQNEIARTAGGDILVLPKRISHCTDERARDTFYLCLAVFFRVELHSALAASHRYIHDSAFYCHRGCERLHFI